MELTRQQIISITGAKANDCDINIKCYDLFTDSRSYYCQSVFCAIRTQSSDGHRYIPDMLAAGVQTFLVEKWPDLPIAEGVCVMKVPSVPRAIADIARFLRHWYDGKMVAVTGSAGKTVVKEMLFSMLLPHRHVWRSPRSWNSRLGVPLTLCNDIGKKEVEIVEVGIDTVGDMAVHADMLRPHIGILTAITHEHDAGFSSLDEKIREKALLFQTCTDIVVDGSCARAPEIVREMYPDKNIIVTGGETYLQADYEAAAAAARLLGVKDPVAPAYMVSSRLNVHEGVNGCLVIADNFTPDPVSLTSALDFTRRRAVPGKSMTLILGDMLRPDRLPADKYYRMAAARAANFGVTRLICVGEEIAAEIPKNVRPNLTTEICTGVRDFLSRYDVNSFHDETILVFGSRDAAFDQIRDMLEDPRHDTVFEINLDSLVHNFNYYRSLLRPETGIIAMVKASAYGTGAPGIARTLQEQGAAYLAVAVVDEGVELRRNGITMPILSLNPLTNSYKALFDYRLEPSVFSLREFHMLLERAERYGVHDYPIHIKLDTGMHRLGFTEAELPALIEALNAQSSLRVATIFSHLATADCLDQDEYTDMQLETFRRASDYLIDHLPYPVRRHILNTAGIMRRPEHQYDLVRPGIGLYGVSPIPGPSPLKTVATLSTTVISIKHWEPGITIGYGRRGVLTRPSVIATLPIGYADGVDRHFSCGRASFSVRGVACPTVGNICMDQCMIDVTAVPDVRIGDRVEIFGPEAPVETLADTLGTIPYELLTSVSPRVRRIYFRE